MKISSRFSRLLIPAPSIVAFERISHPLAYLAHAPIVGRPYELLRVVFHPVVAQRACARPNVFDFTGGEPRQGKPQTFLIMDFRASDIIEVADQEFLCQEHSVRELRVKNIVYSMALAFTGRVGWVRLRGCGVR